MDTLSFETEEYIDEGSKRGRYFEGEREENVRKGSSPLGVFATRISGTSCRLCHKYAFVMQAGLPHRTGCRPLIIHLAPNASTGQLSLRPATQNRTKAARRTIDPMPVPLQRAAVGVPSGLIMDSPLIDAYLLTYIVTSSGTGYSQPAPFRRAVRARGEATTWTPSERCLRDGWMGETGRGWP